MFEGKRYTLWQLAKQIGTAADLPTGNIDLDQMLSPNYAGGAKSGAFASLYQNILNNTAMMANPTIRQTVTDLSLQIIASAELSEDYLSNSSLSVEIGSPHEFYSTYAPQLNPSEITDTNSGSICEVGDGKVQEHACRP